MRVNRTMRLVEYIALLVLTSGASAQTGQSADTGTSTSIELKHALQHLDQLSRLAALAAPTPELRKLLDQRTLPPLKANFGVMASDASVPASSRQAAKNIIGAQHIDALSDVLSRNSTAEGLSFNNSRSRIPLENTTLQLDQVLTTQLPAMSVRPTSPGSTGLSSITACMIGSGFYPPLNQKMNQRTVAIRQLANSVGRIEIKIGNGIPELDGTGFVIDQANGVIATACHVAYDVADYDVSSKTGTIPARKWGRSAEILIDFGFTDVHDPQNEFKVTGVAFIPGLTGCDGALLKVDTSAKPLPPALHMSTSELASPLNAFVDVFSVGYPSRNLAGATPASRDYFTCIRSADPTAAKFVFGGEVTAVEPQTGYDILTHIVPTVGGQSGSPIIQFLNTGEMQVIGIHICCTQSAQVPAGPSCELRNEPFLQEAISIVDIIRLANSAGATTVSFLKVDPK